MIAAAQRKWLALALLLGVQFMVVLDIAIVNVALPSIQKDLGFSERNPSLGAWGAVGASGAVAGVLLGGVLTSALSWHWIFYVNVPVGVLGLALAPFFLTESRDAHAKSFDIPGAALVTGGLVTLVYAITQANSYGW